MHYSQNPFRIHPKLATAGKTINWEVINMKDNSMYLVLAATAAGRELLPLEHDLVNKFLLGDLSKAER